MAPGCEACAKACQCPKGEDRSQHLDAGWLGAGPPGRGSEICYRPGKLSCPFTLSKRDCPQRTSSWFATVFESKNTCPVGQQSQPIKGCVRWAAACGCKLPLGRLFNPEQDKERQSVLREPQPAARGVCNRSLPLRLQPPGYARRLPVEKTEGQVPLSAGPGLSLGGMASQELLPCLLQSRGTRHCECHWPPEPDHREVHWPRGSCRSCGARCGLLPGRLRPPGGGRRDSWERAPGVASLVAGRTQPAPGLW